MSDTETYENIESAEYVAFCIGTQEYCVDIMAVREIRGWTEATILPNAPDYVQGVINLRGMVLPIVDLSKRLGMNETSASARHVIIIVKINTQVVGLLVDSVSDILTVPNENIQATPEVASKIANAFIGGVIAMDERMISLLSLENILPTFVETSEAA